jgi:tripartite-type tricarboxylate transporter receptor subunit TctC
MKGCMPEGFRTTKYRTLPKCRQALALALGAVLFAAPAAADYPGKPIRMVVPNTPGGATDVVARLTSPKLSELLGQPIVVENRVAAGGVLGTNQVAQSSPDGYTLIMVFDSFITNPHLFKDVKYDAVRDFAPISLVVRSAQVLVAHPGLGARNLNQFLQLAKSKGDALNFATAGPGTSSRFSMELFRMTAGIEPTTIHYKGGGALINALVGGQVPVSIVTMGVVLQHIKGGKLLALAVTSAGRSPLLPDVPTVAETFPGFEAQSWTGLLAPAGTPKAVVDALNGSMARVLAQPDMKEKFESQGYEVVGSKPEAFGAWIRSESSRWGKVIRERNITLE